MPDMVTTITRTTLHMDKFEIQDGGNYLHIDKPYYYPSLEISTVELELRIKDKENKIVYEVKKLYQGNEIDSSQLT